MPNTDLNPTDAEIIAAIKSGETELFARLRDRYDGYLRYLVERAVRGRASTAAASDASKDADDIAAEINLKIYSSLDDFDPSLASFKTWLTRIAENHVTDWLMKGRLNSRPFEWGDTDGGDGGELPVADGGPSPAEKYLAGAVTDDILETFLGLKNRLMRSYLILKFVFTLDDAKMAEIFGITESAVRSNMWRALKDFSETFAAIEAYADADMDAVADFIRNDAVEVPGELLSGGNSAVRKLSALIESGGKGGRGKKSAGDLHDLARRALAEVLAARRKRKAAGKTMKHTENISAAAAESLSRHIDALLSGSESTPATRGPGGDAETEKLKRAAEAIVLALSRAGVKKHAPKPTAAAAILEEARRKNMSLDEVARRLKLSPAELSILINSSESADENLALRHSRFVWEPGEGIIYKGGTKRGKPSACRVRSEGAAPKSVDDAIRKILRKKYGLKK